MEDDDDDKKLQASGGDADVWVKGKPIGGTGEGSSEDSNCESGETWTNRQIY
jgi:hypothetical protein